MFDIIDDSNTQLILATLKLIYYNCGKWHMFIYVFHCIGWQLEGDGLWFNGVG